MREIKFRAWDGKLMLPVENICFDTKTVEVLIPCDAVGCEGHPIEYDFGNVALMQYTGLKDKNGKEIYEGDLLRHPNGTIAEIRYLNDLAAFVAIYKQNGNTEVDYLDKEIVNKCKVIGNIYENPELLEGRE